MFSNKISPQIKQVKRNLLSKRQKSKLRKTLPLTFFTKKKRGKTQISFQEMKMKLLKMSLKLTHILKKLASRPIELGLKIPLLE